MMMSIDSYYLVMTDMQSLMTTCKLWLRSGVTTVAMGMPCQGGQSGVGYKIVNAVREGPGGGGR